MEKTRGNILKSVKTYLKLGRLFGATNTWGAIFIGAVTSSTLPGLSDAFKLLIISLFAHAYIGSINEYWHIEEDKKNPQYQYKPLVKGDINSKNALLFIFFCYIMMIATSAFFYPNLISFFSIVIAALFGTIYTIKGKYVAWAYDITPSVGAAFLVIYGASSVGGVTLVTIFASLCAFMISIYSEWIDGMKDVDIDKKFNVPTTAVRWGYSHDKPLSLYFSKIKKEIGSSIVIGDPNLIYFIGIEVIFDIVYLMPFFLGLLSANYFYIFLFFGAPMQIYLTYKLFGIQNKETLRKHPLFFLSTSMFLAFNLVVDKITIWGVILILLFIIGWVYIFSLAGIRFSKN